MPRKKKNASAAATPAKAPGKRGRKPAAAAAAPVGKTSSAAELTRLVSQLRTERQHHIDSIAEIDATFREFGISAGSSGKAGAPGKRGRKPAAEAAPKAGKRGRKPGRKPGRVAKAGAGKGKRGGRGGKFEVTGDQLILDFVRSKGGATTEEIRKHWESSGRRGKAENNLTGLVKSGQLKRIKLEGKPGSRYEIG
ncbi:MAG: hypothetical protein U1A78_34710 [Polyangia bacterium]